MSKTILAVEGPSNRSGLDEGCPHASVQQLERDHLSWVHTGGAGRSRLPRSIAGLGVPNEGTIISQRRRRLGHLAQQSPLGPHLTMLNLALDLVDNLRHRSCQLEILSASITSAGDAELESLVALLAKRSARYHAAGGYDLERRAAAALSGLGFRQNDLDQPVEQLSAGERTRLAVARAFLSEPDLLQLDEATNHLDLDTLTQRETGSRPWRGSFIVVPPDRFFRDPVTERTLALGFGRLDEYAGNHSRFRKLRAQRMALRWAQYETQQEFIRKDEASIRRYRAEQRTRDACGRSSRLERLARPQRPRVPTEPRFRLSTEIRSSRVVLADSELVPGYPASAGQAPLVVCQTTELVVVRGERIGMIGANGAGRTTLPRSLVGEHYPHARRIRNRCAWGLLYLGTGTAQSGVDRARHHPRASVNERRGSAGSDSTLPVPRPRVLEPSRLPEGQGVESDPVSPPSSHRPADHPGLVDRRWHPARDAGELQRGSGPSTSGTGRANVQRCRDSRRSKGLPLRRTAEHELPTAHGDRWSARFDEQNCNLESTRNNSVGSNDW